MSPVPRADRRRQEVPLVFYGVIGQDVKEKTSPSFFNFEEIVIVLDYTSQILEMREIKVCGKLVDRFSISIS